MRQSKKTAALLLAAAMLFSLAACGKSATATSPVNYTQDNKALTFDSAKWNYDATNDVYWQIGVQYCATPQDTNYETLGVYVPGAYLSGTKNSDGTYTCAVKADGTVGSYKASTAPIVIPVNTPGYAASAAPTEYNYDEVSTYLKAGLIYLQPGIRGKKSMMSGGMGGGQMPGAAAAADTSAAATATTGTAAASAAPASAAASSDTSAAVSASASASTEASGGVPWGVTDLKAAIRYYRFNASSLPGNTESIFTFGMSGGGAQSALVGATGDSGLYIPYLTTIGAAMVGIDGNTLSDAVCGSMCWCPITSLDEADEAYEWNMGQFASTGARADTSFASQLSKDLATSYADYINALKLKADGKTLTLEKSDSGIYQKGSYYDYLLSVVETSLNNFLSDTTFPYTPTQQAEFPGGQTGTFGGGTAGAAPSGMPTGAAGAAGTDTSATATAASTTYQTAQEYIDSLNGDSPWITYDASTNTAKVTSLQAFVTNCKTATKSVGAFDEVDRGQGENTLFGDGDTTAMHFDQTIADLLKKNTDAYAKYSDWNAAYVTDYADDLAKTDSVGTSQQTRVDMYNPMYFLCDYYKGSGSSTPAKYWRIRTGIDQSDTALTVETNLALALQANSNVEGVDFATVWGMKHVEAERTGDKTTNFIEWVSQCVTAK